MNDNTPTRLDAIEKKLRSALDDVVAIRAMNVPKTISVDPQIVRPSPTLRAKINETWPKKRVTMTDLPLKRVSIKKAAKLLGIHISKIYSLIKREEVRSFHRPAVVSSRQVLRALNRLNH
jgi:hypothetical protein